jgi:hypothetical protein
MKGLLLPSCLVLLLLISGCVHDPGPSKTAAAMNITPEEALARLDRRDQERDLLTAVAEATVNTENGRYPLRLAILAAVPASLRLEAIPVIGLPNFFLAGHAGRLAVYLPGNGEYYTGAAGPDNLARFFPLPLSVGDLVSLLRGRRPALPAAAKPLQIEGFPEGGTYRLNIVSQDRQFRQSLWIDPETGYLHRCEQEGKGSPGLLNVYFEAYAPVAGAELPHRMRVKITGKEEITVTWEYESLTLEKLNTDREELFTLPAPPGVRVIHLD